jgi:5-methylcytosine-specific restriction endonuclease McrA
VQDRTRERTRKKRRAKAGLGLEQINSGEEVIRKEKEKARHLRQTAWWMRKIREGVCYYCRQKVGSKNLTMDHVIPLSRGGKSLKGNIVPCCKECNNRKKYLIPVEWEEYLKLLAREQGLDD